MAKNETRESCYDVVIVGAGIAGILVANRLLSSTKAKIALVDSHPVVGGRSRCIDWDKKQWAANSGFMSEKLYSFVSNAFVSNPLHAKKSSLGFKLVSTAILTQNKIVKFSSLLDKNIQIPKVLGGLNAQKQWLNLWDKAFGSLQENDKSLAKSLNITSKDPLASTFKLMSYWTGVSSWLHVLPRAIKERNEYLSSLGSQVSLYELYNLLVDEENCDGFSLCLEEKIISANFSDDFWQLKTSKRLLRAKKIIVSHSPWEALSWLNREDFPQALLKMALRSKPTSIVALTKKIISSSDDLYDQTIIASERVIAKKVGNNFCFTFSLDYESSISAPEVTKAIKALRRAASKLEKFVPDLVLEKEYIALYPIAWGQSTSVQDAGYIKNLSDYSFFKKNLAFCGESYGESYRPDENIIKSVLACARYLAE